MKKGFTLGQLPQVFLVVLFIGIIVGATYITLVAFRTSAFTPTTITEQLAFTNNAYTTLTYPYLTSASAVSNIGNTSLNLTSGNYTVNLTSLSSVGDPQYQINFTKSTQIANGNYNITYIYNKESKATAGIYYTLQFLDNIVNNLPTVGIIVFIVVLIGVLMYIRMKKTSGGA